MIVPRNTCNVVRQFLSHSWPSVSTTYNNCVYETTISELDPRPRWLCYTIAIQQIQWEKMWHTDVRREKLPF
jgi:hypothetical protein